MTTPDPFEHSDAAYVFGALDPAEVAQFETHLLTCAGCAARVAQARGLTTLLADINIDEVLADDSLPDTLLPGLLRRAAVKRRQQRWVVGTLASVAAACLAALVVLVWPSGSSSHGQIFAMRALVPSPVSATVELAQTSSGTSIKLHCVYRGKPGDSEAAQYALVVTDRNHHPFQLSTWKLGPGGDETFPATTALPEGQISSIDVTYHGTTILTAAP